MSEFEDANSDLGASGGVAGGTGEDLSELPFPLTPLPSPTVAGGQGSAPAKKQQRVEPETPPANGAEAQAPATAGGATPATRAPAAQAAQTPKRYIAPIRKAVGWVPLKVTDPEDETGLDPATPAEKETPYPPDGDCHVRLGRMEWNIIQALRRRDNLSVNQAVNYLARYHQAYPVELEQTMDVLGSIDQHTSAMYQAVEDLIAAIYELQVTTQELDEESQLRLPQTWQPEPAPRPKEGA